MGEELYRAEMAPRWLDNARTLLHEHRGPGLRMQAIASTVGVHPVHLSRSFRQYFGVTMSDYLRDLRVRRACAALHDRERSRSLSRIAIALGFSDHAHFTRVFKESLGLTPAEYRRRCRLAIMAAVDPTGA